jgi:arylsulfatase A-like enzyme
VKIIVNEKSKGSIKDTLALAAGFGLITGLVEGLLLFALHQTGWLTWRLYNRAIWYETLWIAPLVDLILFGLAGLVFTLVGNVFGKETLRKVLWFVFSCLCLFDWLFAILYGRISLIAIFVLAVGLSVQVFNSLSKRENLVAQMVRRVLPWLAGLVVALFVVIQGGGWVREKVGTRGLPEPQSDAPNVIVIVVDTLRADHLTSYGYERDTTPFMDSLASEGVRFDNAISPSSWTQPSHASILTGRHTYEHQAETEPLDDSYPTIGEVMQKNGYRTAAFSANTLFFTRRQGFGRGFLHFEDDYYSVPDAFLNSSLYGFLFDFYGLRKALNYEGVPARRIASDINRSVLKWVDQDTDRPFFVFMNYFDVHDPYTPPEPYRNKYASVPNPGGLINGFMERFHPDLTPEQLQSEIDAYDGAISYVDDEIRNLFNALEQRGLLENTIVIITSDHGESLGEHGLLQHSASLYLQEIHVPLIIWGPGLVPAGTVIDSPVSLVGLPVTIMELLHANDGTFPGRSLTMLFEETTARAWPQPIAELAHLPGAAEINPSTHGALKSVVGDEMQYIVHEKFGEELYDWRSDPEETKNLISEPSSRSVAENFRRYLENLIGELFNP